MRASVTRYLMLRELQTSDDADHLLGLVDEICYQSGEDVEDYLWRAKNEAERPISDPEGLRLAVEDRVAADLNMPSDELRLVLRRSQPD